MLIPGGYYSEFINSKQEVYVAKPIVNKILGEYHMNNNKDLKIKYPIFTFSVFSEELI